MFSIKVENEKKFFSVLKIKKQQQNTQAQLNKKFPFLFHYIKYGKMKCKNKCLYKSHVNFIAQKIVLQNKIKIRRKKLFEVF